MDALRIRSINIHGLRNKKRRTKFFRFLKRSNIDITCVQESYITKNDEELWQKEWGGQLFYSPGTTHSNGQLILVKSKFKYDIKCVKKEDRILAVEIDLLDNVLHIANVYAPIDSEDKRAFFEDLVNHNLNVVTQNIIFCGDMNCVRDNKLDIISGGNHSKRDIDKFNEFISTCDLHDTWRLFHTDEKEFSWSVRMKQPPYSFIARRIDYILVTESVLNNITECNIFTITNTDHRAVDFLLKLSKVQRGPSYWKFNDSLLKDEKFTELCNKFIDDFKVENDNENDQNKLELLKIKIKEFCISYCKDKRRNDRNKLSKMQLELNELDKHLSKNPLDKDNALKRENLKKDLEIIEMNVARGAQIRSRAIFIEHSEKNSAYFLGLEKSQSR